MQTQQKGGSQSNSLPLPSLSLSDLPLWLRYKFPPLSSWRGFTRLRAPLRILKQKRTEENKTKKKAARRRIDSGVGDSKATCGTFCCCCQPLPLHWRGLPASTTTATNCTDRCVSSARANRLAQCFGFHFSIQSINLSGLLQRAETLRQQPRESRVPDKGEFTTGICLSMSTTWTGASVSLSLLNKTHMEFGFGCFVCDCQFCKGGMMF